MVRDMTRGSITRHLVSFSIPLVLGNLFQLMYNAVDSIVVGKFGGEDALAAVGTGNPVMNIVILGITGICIGASVLMSEFFGAKDMEKLKREISTTLLLGSVFSVLIAVLGLFFSGWILKMMDVPEGIFSISVLYLRIIFLGMPFTFFYNAYAAVMRSVGDSKTPVKFLAFASVLNAYLDLLFVAGFHMGVLGAGLATVIAEGVSAGLCLWYVNRNMPMLRLKRSELKVDRQMLKLTLQHGSVTALQQSCQPIGKLLIQRSINSLGITAMAVFNAVSRVDDFAFTPEQSISSGMMTFVSQNRGAKQGERMKKGLPYGLRVEAGYWVLICTAILLLKTPIMNLFVEESEAIRIGVDYLTLMAFFYLLPAFTNGIQGFFRGMGNMTITLVSTLIQISVRVVFVYLLVPSMGIPAVAWASLIGWLCMLAAEVPYYFVYMKRWDNKNSQNLKGA